MPRRRGAIVKRQPREVYGFGAKLRTDDRLSYYARLVILWALLAAVIVWAAT